MTANADGTLESEIRYTAFGEVRQSGGTTETPYQYTGQLSQMEEIGLYYYVARWYDPDLNRFLSPDTIVADPYNPLDWDQYQYVRSNPISYVDPSGNKPCNGENSGEGVCDQVTNQDWQKVIKWAYGWTTNGTFTNKELGMILDAGAAIENYITTTTEKWGQGWVRKHLGNAVFNQGSTVNAVAEKIGASAFVFPTNDVNLRKGSYVSSTIVHELGHVLDNNNQHNRSGIYPATFVGGGPADAMVFGDGW